MVKRRAKPGADEQKTSLALSVALWREVKIRAAQDGVSARDVVVRALEQYLRKR